MPTSGSALQQPEGKLSKRSREAKFVSIRVDEVEISLAPRRVAWSECGRQAGRESALVLGVDIINIEDCATPPAPCPLSRHRREVQIAAASMKAGEVRIWTPILEREAERPIERNRTGHIARC
jgi:hypothetical protein